MPVDVQGVPRAGIDLLTALRMKTHDTIGDAGLLSRVGRKGRSGKVFLSSGVLVFSVRCLWVEFEIEHLASRASEAVP